MTMWEFLKACENGGAWDRDDGVVYISALQRYLEAERWGFIVAGKPLISKEGPGDEIIGIIVKRLTAAGEAELRRSQPSAAER